MVRSRSTSIICDINNNSPVLVININTKQIVAYHSVCNIICSNRNVFAFLTFKLI